MNTYERNTDPTFWARRNRKCNCGSFALNVTSWFPPCDNNSDYTHKVRETMMQEMYDEGYSREEIMEAVLQRDQEEILNTCPWIEPVLPEEIKPEDKVIAYRIGVAFAPCWSSEFFDEDYHFRIRIGGFWFEKCGEEDVQLCADQNVTHIWNTLPDLVYDSEIVYFRYIKEF